MADEIIMGMTSIEYLDRLIAYPTISRDSNLDLIGFVRSEPALRIVALADVALGGGDLQRRPEAHIGEGGGSAARVGFKPDGSEMIAVQIADDAGGDLHIRVEVFGVDAVRVLDVIAEIDRAAEAVALPDPLAVRPIEEVDGTLDAGKPIIPSSSMFELPSLNWVQGVVICKEVVDGEAKPLLIYSDRESRPRSPPPRLRGNCRFSRIFTGA